MDPYGLFIGKEGFNALTAAEVNLAFSSQYKTFKVLQTGTAAFSGDETFDIVHGLGYNPGFMVFFEETINASRVLADIFAVPEVEDIQVNSYTADSDTLHISVGGFGYTGAIRYFIFADVGE